MPIPPQRQQSLIMPYIIAKNKLSAWRNHALHQTLVGKHKLTNSLTHSKQQRTHSARGEIILIKQRARLHLRQSHTQ